MEDLRDRVCLACAIVVHREAILLAVRGPTHSCTARVLCCWYLGSEKGARLWTPEDWLNLKQLARWRRDFTWKLTLPVTHSLLKRNSLIRPAWSSTVTSVDARPKARCTAGMAVVEVEDTRTIFKLHTAASVCHRRDQHVREEVLLAHFAQPRGPSFS